MKPSDSFKTPRMDALIFDQLRGFNHANSFSFVHIGSGSDHATFSDGRALRTHFVQLLPDGSMCTSIVLYGLPHGD